MSKGSDLALCQSAAAALGIEIKATAIPLALDGGLR